MGIVSAPLLYEELVCLRSRVISVRTGFRRSLSLFKRSQQNVVLSSRGKCPICRSQVRFVALDPWLRDHFLCPKCRSIPRERDLMAVIDRLFPAWPSLSIHESSPAASHGVV